MDTHLGIRRFPPNMNQFFNLIPSDTGHSLRDITSKTGYDNICQDAEEVLLTLQTKEREIKAGADGQWYNLRILPYRTSENVIDGVVLTFVDITARKRLEDLRQAARIFAESIVDTVREPLLVIDGDLMVWPRSLSRKPVSRSATWWPKSRPSGKPRRPLRQRPDQKLKQPLNQFRSKDGNRGP